MFGCCVCDANIKTVVGISSRNGNRPWRRTGKNLERTYTATTNSANKNLFSFYFLYFFIYLTGI